MKHFAKTLAKEVITTTLVTFVQGAAENIAERLFGKPDDEKGKDDEQIQRDKKQAVEESTKAPGKDDH